MNNALLLDSEPSLDDIDVGSSFESGTPEKETAVLGQNNKGVVDDSALPPEFRKMLRIVRTDYKYEIKPEINRRKRYPPPKRRPARSRFFIPEVDEFTSLLLQEARQSVDERLNCGKEIPSGDDIRGAVVIMERKESGLILLCLDTGKQRPWLPARWGFPGGGRKEGESIDKAVLREQKEEINIDGRRLKYYLEGVIHLLDRSPENYENEQTVFSDKKTAVLYTKLPEQLVKFVKKGREQSRLEWVDKHTIHLLIAAGMFLDNHTNYWHKFVENHPEMAI